MPQNSPSHLESLLVNAGLSAKEAQLYTLLLEVGSMRAAYLQQRLKFKRGNTYALLSSLIDKGLIMKKGLEFIPQSPQHALELLKRQAERIRSSLATFEQEMPRIMSSYKLAIGKPTLKYFEGKEGIKEIFEDIYAPKTIPVVYGCVDLETTNDVLPDYVTKKLIPKRIKNKVTAISLVADSQLSRTIKKDDQAHLRKTHLVDKKEFPLPAEIDVYEDKIAMMTFKQGDFLGFIIEHPDFAQTLRSIFKRLFWLEELHSMAEGPSRGLSPS